MPRRLIHLSLVGAAVALTLGACAPTRNTGQSGGRIDPYSTTRADELDRAANAPTLWEFSDQVAESLAQRIATIPEINNSPYRAIVELGSIENRTSTPTQDFELIQRRLRSRLLSSNVVTDRVKFVEPVAVMDREHARVQGEGYDPLQRDLSGGATDRYDPNQTYVLRGSFFESTRGGGATSRYFFEFELVNLQTRAIVFNDSIDHAQVR